MKSWIVFVTIWLLGIGSVVQAYRDAKNNGKLIFWIMCACAVSSFVLLPIDRYLADQEVNNDISKLQEKIRLTEELVNSEAEALRVVTEKNVALEKQIFILNSYRKNILRLGLNISVRFSLRGQQQLHSYYLIPTVSTIYATAISSDGKSVPFQAQDSAYNLNKELISNEGTTYLFSTRVEVLNSQYPIGEKLNELKKFHLINVFVPFLSKTVLEEGPLRNVKIHNLNIEVTINGKRIKKTFGTKNIISHIGRVHYSDQDFWFQVPILFKKNIYSDLELGYF